MKNHQKTFKPTISEEFDDYVQIGRPEEPYVASKPLIEAFNLAVFLERPLLLKGEPGCGKTRFAEAVAYEIYKESSNYRSFYEEWYIKSTSKAQEGLYSFDHIGRLSDAQLSHSKYVDDKLVERLQDPEQYLQLTQLGKAFQSKEPTIVLIDEIDKADLDFPNDLLLELDRKKFYVNEVIKNEEKMEVVAKTAPIIIITSNNEKELPAPFLRRCLFHRIGFPTEHQLIQIINSHFHKDHNDPLVGATVRAFLKLRKAMQTDKKDTEKKSSTSELLDWFHTLNARREHLPTDQQELEEYLSRLPFASVLLKSWEDHLTYFERQKHLNY